MHDMVKNELLNYSTFTTNYLGRVACATTRGISVGGMITQITENLGLEFNLEVDKLVEGNTKVDMDALIHQGTISIDGNTYTMMIQNKAIIDLPNPRRVMVAVENNWLYKADTHTLGNFFEDEDDPKFDIFYAWNFRMKTLYYHLLVLPNMKPSNEN